MSGIDDYTRFYWTVDSALNLAVPDDSVSGEYPSLGTASYDGSNNPVVSGVYGSSGYRFYSTITSPARSKCYYPLIDKQDFFAISGLDAFLYSDYTIEFWIKVTGSGKSPIITNAFGWGIFYETGTIYQSQGLTHKVGCTCDLTGSFHHVEFVRESGVSKVFIDGVSQTLLYNYWNPSSCDPNNWFLGVSEDTYSDVDYVLDEVRFSTGIARHFYNFDVPTESYTRDDVTEIASPVDGIITLDAVFDLVLTVPAKVTVPAITTAEIRFSDSLSFEITFPERLTAPSITNGQITFEGLLELDSGCNGLTLPSVDDIEISFDVSLGFESTFTGDTTEVVYIEDTIYELINNNIEIPISMESSIIIDLSSYVAPDFEYRFLNSLLLEADLTLINGLNFDFSIEEYTFPNALTSILIVDFFILNDLLVNNEVEKESIFLNRIDASGAEVYDGFYFSKTHGV